MTKDDKNCKIESVDPAEIWLQAKPYSCDGRLWSEDPHEGEDGTKYIRADLAHATSTEAEATAEALRWYAENVEGCRKTTPEGDAARQALDRDGGKRARAALARQEPTR